LNPQIIDNEELICQIYDIYQNLGKELTINLRVTKFDGLSQIIIDNKLYLIGSNAKKIKSDNYFMSSNLIKIEFNDVCIPHIKILTSSEYPHYQPSLAKYKNEEIFVIGGKDNVTCEAFSLKFNKWKKLKNLPIERFGCSVICDENQKLLFLFGGYNNSTNSFNSSVLKYNLKVNLEWETLIISSNSNLLQRSYCASFKTKNNSIILLGGSTNYHPETDDIIEYNYLQKDIKLLKLKLNKPATFISIQFFEDDEINNLFYGFDSDNIIHKINLSGEETFKLNINDYLIKDTDESEE